MYQRVTRVYKSSNVGRSKKNCQNHFINTNNTLWYFRNRVFLRLLSLGLHFFSFFIATELFRWRYEKSPSIYYSTCCTF